MRIVRVRDLKPQTGMSGQRPLLLCRGECAGEYSANAGDYFMARPDTILRCCGEPMALVVKQTVYNAA